MRRRPTPPPRGFLRLGLGNLGLSLPALLRAERAPTAPKPARPRARSCILFFLEGGPAHQDLWDLKPEAPVEYRGEFRPISTSVPGLQVCEHLPLLARQMHHCALVRSVSHTVVDHNAENCAGRRTTGNREPEITAAGSGSRPCSRPCFPSRLRPPSVPPQLLSWAPFALLRCHLP